MYRTRRREHFFFAGIEPARVLFVITGHSVPHRQDFLIDEVLFQCTLLDLCPKARMDPCEAALILRTRSSTDGVLVQFHGLGAFACLKVPLCGLGAERHDFAPPVAMDSAGVGQKAASEACCISTATCRSVAVSVLFPMIVLAKLTKSVWSSATAATSSSTSAK